MRGVLSRPASASRTGHRGPPVWKTSDFVVLSNLETRNHYLRTVGALVTTSAGAAGDDGIGSFWLPAPKFRVRGRSGFRELLFMSVLKLHAYYTLLFFLS